MMPTSDQGVTLDRYILVPRVLIFVTRGNSVLLLKGAPTKRLWANKYNGVGGHVERGEDILSAARSELLEEAGLTADLWLCGTVVVDTGENPGIGIYVFTGECPEREPKPSTEGLVLSEVERLAPSEVEGTLIWISFGEVENLPAVEDLPILLGRIRQMKRGDPPFSVRSFYEVDQLRLEFIE